MITKTHQKPTVCYIASVSHSGSTVMNILLVEHFGGLAVGESRSVLDGKGETKEGSHEYCSCGARMEQCLFWGEVQNSLSKYDFADRSEKYLAILKQAEINNTSIIFDSSKHSSFLKDLKKLHDEDQIDLKVLFLMRDVRGWVTSQKNIAKRDGVNSFLLTIRRIRNWYTFNRAMLRDIQSTNLPFLLVGYESLVFKTDFELDRIGSFLSLHQPKLSASNIHVAQGNRAKKTFDPKKGLSYDFRWFTDFWTQFWVIVFFPVLVWNNDVLYRQSPSNEHRNL